MTEAPQDYLYLFENHPLPMWVYDLQSLRFLAVNNAAVVHYGYSEAEFLGMTIKDIRPSEDIPALMENVVKVTTGLDVAGAWRHIRKDGTLIDVEIISHTLDFLGRPAELVSIHDITDRKHAERQRLEMERQLLHAQKLECLGILAGSVAHDFNNLLTAIIGHLDLARQDVNPDTPLHPRLTKALRASQQAVELTRQLLAYAGRGQFEIKPVDLRELVRANAELLQVSVGRAVTLEVVDMGEPLPLILADSAHLQQVIMNLITNASEAIGEQPGSITLRLAVTDFADDQLCRSVIMPAPAAGRYLTLEVVDTGCGMDEEIQRRMFEPFFTTKFTGRGLGMSATLGIVRELQGALLIDSAPGRGTTIRVLFPPLDEANPPVAPSQPEYTLADPVAFAGTMLIVDDEEVVRFITSEYAKFFGFNVLTAENGEEGAWLFSQHADRIACVLLDLTMPVMGGLETFRRIRQIRSDAKVILSSGYIEREATERFFGEGLAGFIQKPYNKQDLRQKLVEVLLNGSPSPS